MNCSASHDFVNIGNDRLEVVKSVMYLGHIISFNLMDFGDLEKRLKESYGKFNVINRNFSNISFTTQSFRFKSYCSPDFRHVLWNKDDSYMRQIYGTFQIACARALKRMLGVPSYASIHLVDGECDLPFLDHHIIINQLRSAQTAAGT